MHIWVFIFGLNQEFKSVNIFIKAPITRPTSTPTIILDTKVETVMKKSNPGKK